MPPWPSTSVEVTRLFTAAGEVHPVQVPAGEVATTVHRGSYDRLGTTHDAIHVWRAQQNWRFPGLSWEIYSDWSADPGKLETTVCYLLVGEPRRGDRGYAHLAIRLVTTQ